MTPKTAYFEITKRSGRPYRSLTAPTVAMGAAGRGIAFIEDPAAAGVAKLADGSAPIAGFVTRPILAGGPTLADAVMPNRIELPFSDGSGTGDSVAGSNIFSLEQAEEVEAEAYDATLVSGNLYTGSGALTITAATPIQTRCSFRNGQFCIAASGDYSEYLLQEIETPMVAGNVRARFTKVEGQKVV